MGERKISEFDVSRDRDLGYAVTNLIEAEGHLQQTHAETKDKKYLHIIKAIRDIRGKYFEKFLQNKNLDAGECLADSQEMFKIVFLLKQNKVEYGVWCASKHLLSASMELSEVGSKLIDNLED